jgi:hypothetical protein
MKQTILFILLFASQSFARSVAPPRITVTNVTNGATTLDGVFCILYEGRNAGTVDGVVVVRTSLLGEGVNLAAWDSDGNLLVSCPLDAEEEQGFSVFFFMLKKDFLPHAMLTVFPTRKMYECHLGNVPLKTEKASGVDALIDTITSQSEARPTTPSTPTK